MGRYTTVQTYSDQNTKVVPASAIASMNEKVESESQAKKKLQVEKVNNVMGSCAGAGSGEFDVYRASRRREITRIESLEYEQKAEEEARLFAEKIARNKEEAENRTTKNAEKRNKKKMKKMELKRKHTDISDSDAATSLLSSSSDNKKEEVQKL